MSEPATASAPPAPAGVDATTGIALGFGIAAWILYAVLGPIAVFLTWWGECLEDPCLAPTAFDQALYIFDVAWWLAFPIVAYLAYRGRRAAWAALLVFAIVLDLQLLFAVAGLPGFDAFALTLPAAALLTFGAALGLVMQSPSIAARPDAAAVGQVGAIGCLGLVVALIAVQGLIVGASGPLVGILLVMAIALGVIAVAAYANRGRRTAPARSTPPVRRRR